MENFTCNKLDLFDLTPAQKKFVMAVGRKQGVRPKYAVSYINEALALLEWKIRLRAIMGKDVKIANS